MLKALELTGFKSFADKTRFEFPPGITVVVGPNGSGKSNIVDGIKWVLGEQSAKSLRGKDMSDVIFKGSGGATGRRPANSATATIILDNADHRFAFDADEVHVSRRVYRSGESEYLINGENCRLKDIRELFRGTGVGTDAYSLIEQGKVERLLSANAKDRRAVFEEAAGISRFKAKKKDAQRRLARVEGNLIRLADIVEEVGSRYRSVKSQASKAAKFKECSDRLQQLRTYIGSSDWRQFSQQLDKANEKLATDQSAIAELESQLADGERQIGELEASLASTQQGHADLQEQSNTLRETLARCESNLQLNRSRLQDIETRQPGLSAQIERATLAVEEAQQRIDSAGQESSTAQQDHQSASSELEQLRTRLQQLSASLTALKQRLDQAKTQREDQTSAVAQWGRKASAAEQRLANLSEVRQMLIADRQAILSQATRYQQKVEQAQSAIESLQTEAASRDTALADSRNELDEARNQLGQASDRLNEQTRHHAGLSQRAQVIEELEKSLEGINAGAKELLTRAQQSPGLAAEVVGLVADLVSVNVQHAGLVDVALGELAQFVIVQGDRLVNQIAAQEFRLQGRVGLIQLGSPPSLGADLDVDLHGVNGVVGRADHLVQVQDHHKPFIEKLLGGTWLVKTLGVALHLRESHPGASRVRLVTLDGEIVETDGAVVVGPKATAAGLVSRRSELRALQREIASLEMELHSGREAVESQTQNAARLEQQVETQLHENSELSARLSDQNTRAEAAQTQLSEIHEKRQRLENELDQNQESRTASEAELAEAQQQLQDLEDLSAELRQTISDHERQLAEQHSLKTDLEEAATEASVKLARAEQVLEGSQARVEQLQLELDEKQHHLQQLTEQSQQDKAAAEQATSRLASETEALERHQQEHQQVDQQLQQSAQRRNALEDQRRELTSRTRSLQDQRRRIQDDLHQSQLQIEQLTLQRNQLAERLRDDYGIDIASAESDLSDEELQERESVDREIQELRQRLNALGSVNLDALEELEELESRYLSMDQQYQDLVEAKETLARIISRIDNDSRKLFVETVETIRVNFQKLFRQTFGGGKADIVLEADVDPLEAGVEIVATPPGKPEFSNSLLSGGEKALTAVSLLMAIFQFRPSPFCVLDEVDAPFDEANIGRFIDVLRSFLGWTKFVIVTHSKKTMTAATTLYGITMQESGVSKRVSVRFEDVSEDGHISPEAIRRSDDDAA